MYKVFLRDSTIIIRDNNSNDNHKILSIVKMYKRKVTKVKVMMNDEQFEKQKKSFKKVSIKYLIEGFEQFDDELKDLNTAKWDYRKLYLMANELCDRLKLFVGDKGDFKDE